MGAVQHGGRYTAILVNGKEEFPPGQGDTAAGTVLPATIMPSRGPVSATVAVHSCNKKPNFSPWPLAGLA